MRQAFGSAEDRTPFAAALLDGCIRAAKRGLAVDLPRDAAPRGVIAAGFGVLAVALVLRLVLWVYAGTTWEDALISTLHAVNAAEGLGLTHYHPGQPPVHGFTSPFSVLIPLAAELLWSGAGLPFMKLICFLSTIPFFVYLLGFLLSPRVNLSRSMVLLVMGYCAVSHLFVLFAVAGMETQLVLTVIAGGLYYLAAKKWNLLGIFLGLAMLARPDMCLWTGVVGVYLLLTEPRQIGRIVGISLALYAPWLLFAHTYYGSVIPHTITAKGLGYFEALATSGLSGIAAQFDYGLRNAIVHLSPAYDGHGAGTVRLFWSPDRFGAARSIILFWVLCAGAGVVRAALLKRPLWMLVAAYACAHTFYTAALTPHLFPWYKPPFLMVFLLIAVFGLEGILGLFPKRTGRWIGAGIAAAYILLFAAPLPYFIHADRMVQRLAGMRMAMGLWFAENAGPNDRIFAEPLGYLSYYSKRWVLDWPGLANPSMVATRSQGGFHDSMAGAIMDHQPEWVVLRPYERKAIREESGGRALQGYVLVRTFVPSAADLAQLPWAHRNIDTEFQVFRRQGAARTFKEEERTS